MKRFVFVSIFGAAALAALIPSAAAARSSFSVTIGSGSSYGYPGYGYPGNGYGYGSGYGDYAGYGRHDRQHDRLDGQPDGVHDDLDDTHDEAHDQGVAPWQHTRLHRDLQEQHGYGHYQLEGRHQRQHRRNAWQRNYNRDSYYRYRGY